MNRQGHVQAATEVHNSKTPVELRFEGGWVRLFQGSEADAFF
jgi:hypothetical protein